MSKIIYKKIDNVELKYEENSLFSFENFVEFIDKLLHDDNYKITDHTNYEVFVWNKCRLTKTKINNIIKIEFIRDNIYKEKDIKLKLDGYIDKFGIFRIIGFHKLSGQNGKITPETMYGTYCALLEDRIKYLLMNYLVYNYKTNINEIINKSIDLYRKYHNEIIQIIEYNILVPDLELGQKQKTYINLNFITPNSFSPKFTIKVEKDILMSCKSFNGFIRQSEIEIKIMINNFMDYLKINHSINNFIKILLNFINYK